MSDRRAKNAEIFKDTEYMYRTNKACGRGVCKIYKRVL